MDRLTVAREFSAWLKGRLGERVERVVLFGSVARGDEGAESDIDILIEVRGDPVAVRREIGPRILEVAAQSGYFISAFVESISTSQRSLGIYRTIEREGRVLA